MLDGADGADFRVAAAQLALGVEDRVDMQLRRLRLAAELAETLNELLLEIVGEVVLLAEEDNATLGDY